MDITEHPTGDGKVYLAVVLDAFSRRVVGWSIADHIRTELVVDALQMAIWRRNPPAVRPSRTAIMARSTRLGRSGAGYVRRACSDRWAPSATASTTASPRASSARCNSSCSTNTAGTPATSLPRDLRLDRVPVQPTSTSQLLRDAQPHRLRDHNRRMITTTNPSVEDSTSREQPAHSSSGGRPPTRQN